MGANIVNMNWLTLTLNGPLAATSWWTTRTITAHQSPNDNSVKLSELELKVEAAEWLTGEG